MHRFSFLIFAKQLIISQIDCFLVRDADDAVNGRNNYNFDGHRLKVERPRQSASVGGRSSYIKGRPGPPSQRSNYRVIVEGIKFEISSLLID